MPIKIINQKVCKAFSDAAGQYEQLTSLHKDIGRELIKRIRAPNDAPSILDVGMGTGWLTGQLCSFFPQSLVVGVDFAPGMIEVASRLNEEEFTIIGADARCLPFRSETFDVIVSNLAYHWLEDLPSAFAQCHRTLKKGGILGLTMCGRQTFDELFLALEKTQGPGEIFAIRRLPPEELIAESLQKAGFKNAEIKQEQKRLRFSEMMGLIQWIKDIGANALAQDIYIGKAWLKRASEYYNQHCKDRLGIYATFEVVWVVAKK